MLRAKNVQTAMLSRLGIEEQGEYYTSVRQETLEEFSERVNRELAEIEGLGWDILQVQNTFTPEGDYVVEGFYTVIIYGERLSASSKEESKVVEGTPSA